MGEGMNNFIKDYFIFGEDNQYHKIKNVTDSINESFNDKNDEIRELKELCHALKDRCMDLENTVDMYESANRFLRYMHTKEKVCPVINKIYTSEDGRTTTVIWMDDDKTIVRCMEEDEPDAHVALAVAFLKKCLGSNSQIKKILRDKTVIASKRNKKKETTEDE